MSGQEGLQFICNTALGTLPHYNVIPGTLPHYYVMSGPDFALQVW